MGDLRRDFCCKIKKSCNQNPLFTYTKIQLFLTPRFSQLIMSEILLKFVQCCNSSYLAVNESTAKTQNLTSKS